MTDCSPNDLNQKFKFMLDFEWVKILFENLLVFIDNPIVVFRLRQKWMSFLKAKNSNSNFNLKLKSVILRGLKMNIYFGNLYSYMKNGYTKCQHEQIEIGLGE